MKTKHKSKVAKINNDQLNGSIVMCYEQAKYEAQCFADSVCPNTDTIPNHIRYEDIHSYLQKAFMAGYSSGYNDGVSRATKTMSDE